MADQFAPPVCARIRDTRLRLREEAKAEGGLEAARYFSQEEVARRLGLSLGGYRPYESTREPDYARRREIATKGFGLDADYFEVTASESRGIEDLRAEVAELRDEIAAMRAERRPGRRAPRTRPA